ncbi:M15 family metallopeptidase [uncultured Brachyspira sp.]|uniref:M15 family metallopeptidase n=1 Tax=uncultured Brachyspira sp. TaxID=221953 RepID=UPI0025D13B8B|nr:M15 family metallopeptidase [uncultured Brachyspira sp.]
MTILVIIIILIVLALISFIIKAGSKYKVFAIALMTVIVSSISAIGIIYMNNTSDIMANIDRKTMMIEKEKKRVRKDFIIRPGALEIISLHLAYSNRISPPIIKNRELGFYLDEIWFNWANGKLLTDEDMTNQDKHIPFGFYSYSVNGLPKVEEETSERTQELQEYYKKRVNNTKYINNKFLNTLYDGNNEKTILKHIGTKSILGYKVRVHDYVYEPLSNVSVEVRLIAQTNKEVENFLDSLKIVSGYVWKIISKSSSISYHSYGVAFDTLPKKNYGKQIYWAWTRVNNKAWYAVPYDKRWHPPKEVVKVFEKYGFIWGGKWHNYDTIHFEYRPELIIYNKLKDDEDKAYELVEKYGIF